MNHKRVPPGVPTGGQFAAQARAPAAVSLIEPALDAAVDEALDEALNHPRDEQFRAATRRDRAPLQPVGDRVEVGERLLYVDERDPATRFARRYEVLEAQPHLSYATSGTRAWVRDLETGHELSVDLLTAHDRGWWRGDSDDVEVTPDRLDVPEGGCGLCGVGAFRHGIRLAATGVHEYVEPTEQQRRSRAQAHRAGVLPVWR